MSDGSCRIKKHGEAVIIDGTLEHGSEPFEGSRYSIVAFLHTSTRDLKPADRKTLLELGFNLPLLSSSLLLSPPPTQSTTKRCLIEYCCGEDSLLGGPGAFRDGCMMHRLTIKHDMTTRAGYDHAVNLVRQAGCPILLWVSIPCTGGSPWQKVNLKTVPNMKAKLEEHRRVFLALWENMMPLARKVIRRGGARRDRVAS
jgi:hypothetical protein